MGKTESLNAAKVKAREEQEAEGKRLDQYLSDQRKAAEDEKQKMINERERAKERAKASVMATLERWEAGDKKGNMKITFQYWSQYAMKQKSSERKRQAVHDALARALLGEKKGMMKITFTNWHA